MRTAEPIHSFDLPSRTARMTAGVVFVLVLVMGLASALWSITSDRLSIDISGANVERLLNGQVTHEIARKLAHTPVAEGLAKGQRAGSWLIVGSLGPQVRRGCEPWLFLQDEFTVHTEAVHNAELRLRTVARVRDLLKQRGAELVVATVPDKSRIEAAQLCGLYRPPSFEPRLDDWQAGLERHGIHSAALMPALNYLQGNNGAHAFLTVDSHWSEAGAWSAARAIAQTASHSNVQLTPIHSYKIEREDSLRPRAGDLVRLAGIDWMPQPLQPPRDVVHRTRFSLMSTEPNENPNSVDDLFGDSNLPTVALVGTSLSGASQFVQFLEAELNTPVPNFALDGGDFWRSVHTYLESTDYQHSPPKLVVWEIPERVIQMPIAPEERAWMQALGTWSKRVLFGEF